MFSHKRLGGLLAISFHEFRALAKPSQLKKFDYFLVEVWFLPG